MKSYLFLILIVTMFFVVTKSEDEEYYTTEQPNEEGDTITTTTENALLRTGPEEYGKREQLDPDLTGLENFAILYLPRKFNYSNVVNAHREVKDGIRYEILANATDDKNQTIFCNLLVLEKPWFITPWAGRLRVLEKSNCSSLSEIRELNEGYHTDQASIDQAYQNNTIFNPQNKKVSAGNSLDDIEGMIVESKIQKTNKGNVIHSAPSSGSSINNEQNYETTIDSIAVDSTEATVIPTTTSFQNLFTTQSADLSASVSRNEAADFSTRGDDTVDRQNFNNLNQQESGQQTNSEYTTPEAPVVRSDVQHQTGNREKLNENMVGLVNMALVYLPREVTYNKIIEAYREVINGIRYEMLIQANRIDNSEIVCEIQVQEKPWLLTPWGDKVRVLEKSNCSNTLDISDINNRNHIDQAILDDKYSNNTIFNPTGKHVSDDLLDRIESAIVDPKNKRKPIANSFAAATTRQPSFQRQPVAASPTNFQRFNQNNQQQPFSRQQSQLQQQNKQQTTNTVGTLSTDDKEYLDNFFNYFNVNSDNTATTAGQENQAAESHARNKRSPKKYNLKKSEHLFEKFKKKFTRNYESSFETQRRYQIFKSNLLKINQLNKMEQGTAKYGLTEFADMTTTEYRMRTGLLYDSETNRIGNPLADIPNVELPEEFDWRKQGVVSEVKDQGQCGSCWAFSVVGNIEALHAIKSGKLEEYSEQELVDCDTNDKGCQGGDFDQAYKSIDLLGGLESESDYPYVAHQEKCELDASKIRIKIKNGLDLPKNETQMAMWLMKNGPISVGVNANAMMFYRGGVSNPWWPLCRPGGIDHGVLIVGFGIDKFPLYNKTLPYWIIKNSWGKTWGEQGYYRLYRGQNKCGINSMATSAVLD